MAVLWLAGFIAAAVALTDERQIPKPETQSSAALPGKNPEQSPAILSSNLRLISRSLEAAALQGQHEKTIKARSQAWVREVKALGGNPLNAIGELLPGTLWFQARLMTERDEKTLAEEAGTKTEFSRQYTEIQNILPLVRQQAPFLESMLKTIWKEIGLPGASQKALALPLAKSEYWIASKKDLSASHQYALDIFFKSVKKLGAEETGPQIRSMSHGIVVSAASDWIGGDRQSNYKKGGLSPKAGNGVIVFSPDNGRYYAYFHLKNAIVHPGQIVNPGTILGNGGNTGINARKKGHGNHLHIEIHETNGSAWASFSIRSLLLSLKN